MRNVGLIICMAAFTLALVICSKADAQKIDAPSATPQQHILSLNFRNNGQHLTAFVGQQIEITLGTVGPPQYGKPEISSPAIRLVSTALWQTTPAGPAGRYSMWRCEGLCSRSEDCRRLGGSNNRDQEAKTGKFHLYHFQRGCSLSWRGPSHCNLRRIA